jgi:hypothetical protein
MKVKSSQQGPNFDDEAENGSDLKIILFPAELLEEVLEWSTGLLAHILQVSRM